MEVSASPREDLQGLRPTLEEERGALVRCAQSGEDEATQYAAVLS